MKNKKLSLNRRSRLRENLTEARILLQEAAAFLSWSVSTKNYIPYELFQEIKDREYAKERREMMHYLKRQKNIETRKIGKRLELRLTEKGWTQALRDKIKATRARSKNGACFLLFDIPEKEKSSREALRKFLKECGFKRLQQSVWMTDCDVIAPLCKLLQRRKLERWIRIIQGKLLPASPLDRLVIRQHYRT